MVTPNNRRGTSGTVLSESDAELYELASLAGINMQQRVFEIIMELLEKDVAPNAIHRMISSMINTPSKTKNVSVHRKPTKKVSSLSTSSSRKLPEPRARNNSTK